MSVKNQPDAPVSNRATDSGIGRIMSNFHSILRYFFQRSPKEKKDTFPFKGSDLVIYLIGLNQPIFFGL